MPVINKIDLPNADPDTVKQQLELLFDIDPESVLLASAKTGLGIFSLNLVLGLIQSVLLNLSLSTYFTFTLSISC